MQTQRGWTLVELLVVVAIILVLAGIIYAIGAYAVERSRQANCISNLRQIGMALRLYMDDHKQSDWDTEIGSLGDGIIDTIGETRSGILAARWGFPNRLSDLVRGGYVRDARLLRCPSAKPPLANKLVHYIYHHPVVMEDKRIGRINHLRVLKNRMYEYPIVVDISHEKGSASCLYIILRMSGQVETKTVSVFAPFDSIDL